MTTIGIIATSDDYEEIHSLAFELRVLPIVGPSAYVMLRYIVREGLTDGSIDLEKMYLACGLPGKSKNSPGMRALERLIHSGLLEFGENGVTVYTGYARREKARRVRADGYSSRMLDRMDAVQA